MKNLNELTKITRFAVTSAALIIFLTAAGTAHLYAQGNKPTSKSPCIDIKSGTGNSFSYIWTNKDSSVCQDAVGSLRAASLFALGQDMDTKPVYMDDFTFKNRVEFDLKEWIYSLQSNPAYKARFDDGLTIKDATDFLVEYKLVFNHSDKERADFVGDIFDRVYGKPGTKAETDAYAAQIKAKKSWYAPIFLAEKNKLNKAPAEREAMINRAYQKVFNRPASGREMNAWKSRTEIYREIVAQIKK